MKYQDFIWIDIPESELIKKGLCDEYEFQSYFNDTADKRESIFTIYAGNDINLTPTTDLESDFKYTDIDGETHYIFIF